MYQCALCSHSEPLASSFYFCLCMCESVCAYLCFVWVQLGQSSFIIFVLLPTDVEGSTSDQIHIPLSKE